MIKISKIKTKNILISVVTAIMMLVSVQVGSVAALNCNDPTLTTQQAIQCGANGASGQSGSPASAKNGLNNTITKIVNFLSLFVGIAAVVMIIVAGFRYITSGGDATRVSSAKNTVLYSVIGLIIVALAQIIVKFVINTTSS